MTSREPADRGTVPRATGLAAAAAASACSGAQSALAPAGEHAHDIAILFWWMAAGAVVVWAAVVALALHYSRHAPASPSERRNRLLIVGAGVVVPSTVLTILLAAGLARLPAAVARAPAGSLTIHVVGEQWWWRVRYRSPGGQAVDLANEIRLPVGEPVQFQLESDNVIHSFWIPSLAGKMDMIPGRVTYLTVRPTATGVFRGACAEYCGTAHALMAFAVEVMDRQEFADWLEGQAADALPPETPEAGSGRELFLSNGCGACHTVRGTPADGVIGPDLTHVGSRASVGAGILGNEPGAFRTWIGETERVKPGVHMPSYGSLADEDLRAIAAYLDGLR